MTADDETLSELFDACSLALEAHEDCTEKALKDVYQLKKWAQQDIMRMVELIKLYHERQESRLH